MMGLKRSRLVRRWALILGCWLLVSFLYSSYLYVYYILRGLETTWLEELYESFAYISVWALLTPLILYLADRIPYSPRHWLRNFLIHVPFAMAVSLLEVILHTLTDKIFVHGETSYKVLSEAFVILFARTYYLGVLTYGIILGIRWGFQYYRDQTVREAELKQQLAEAQLEALKMQLHPHFLFNTLHAISSLMQQDVKAADAMLARLSEFLRMTLQVRPSNEVSLREELEMLRLYLSIEEIRFQDRLKVNIKVDPEILDYQVPAWILQPLVENSIRHGIARQRGVGVIEIHGVPQNGRLELSVRDNGVGIRNSTGELQPGIGLSNTKSRLQRMYGEEGRMEIHQIPEGGLEVRLVIPAGEEDTA